MARRNELKIRGRAGVAHSQERSACAQCIVARGLCMHSRVAERRQILMAQCICRPWVC